MRSRASRSATPLWETMIARASSSRSREPSPPARIAHSANLDLDLATHDRTRRRRAVGRDSHVGQPFRGTAARAHEMRLLPPRVVALRVLEAPDAITELDAAQQADASE